MRNNVVALALATALSMPSTVGAPPPRAWASGGGGAFTGVAQIDCFGCGVSAATARWCFTVKVIIVGLVPVIYVCVSRIPVVDQGASDTAGSLTVDEEPGPCPPVSGSAAGDASGNGASFHFTWTRLGSALVMTTSGDINGAGVASFVVTNPAVGNPCGGPVTAEVEGALVGT